MTSPVIGEMMISIRGSNNSESVMKTYKYILSAAIAALAFASCGKEESTSIQGDRRNVTVYCPLTRTTIDYEGSDVSHLVWGAGENIGKLLNRKHYYFVPFKQDNPITKPRSIVFMKIGFYSFYMPKLKFN